VCVCVCVCVGVGVAGVANLLIAEIVDIVAIVLLVPGSGCDCGNACGRAVASVMAARTIFL